ncbi:MAG: hypothetical protein HQK54_02390 [Oligoflexales bacterium]|nr:hypothetical protein [Oligoflexales bacterium]
MLPDFEVCPISNALKGVNLDVIVSGSIGAVESVRFIRSLRRIGAKIQPWLTRGGSQFVTEMSLEWASSQNVIRNFTGKASHIALNDACVVAPASANILGKVASGLTDTPETALIASYLGMRKPVFFVPNMHDSLINSPQVKLNIDKIGRWAVILEARQEEGKNKFPEPKTLADTISHNINSNKNYYPTLLTMGTTRGYVDDVRYFSNYSSGKLGSLIAEELYRMGVPTHVIAGPCQYLPGTCTSLSRIKTNEEMLARCLEKNHHDCRAAIFAASVLDFIPEKRLPGKISSQENLSVKFIKTPKIIEKITPSSGIKVGFKLESVLSPEIAQKLAADYIKRYSLSLIVINCLSDVDENKHSAYLFEKSPQDDSVMEPRIITGKQEISMGITSHVINRMKVHGI